VQVQHAGTLKTSQSMLSMGAAKYQLLIVAATASYWWELLVVTNTDRSPEGLWTFPGEKVMRYHELEIDLMVRETLMRPSVYDALMATMPNSVLRLRIEVYPWVGRESNEGSRLIESSRVISWMRGTFR